jgi:hypothetical protein
MLEEYIARRTRRARRTRKGLLIGAVGKERRRRERQQREFRSKRWKTAETAGGIWRSFFVSSRVSFPNRDRTRPRTRLFLAVHFSLFTKPRKNTVVSALNSSLFSKFGIWPTSFIQTSREPLISSFMPSASFRVV